MTDKIKKESRLNPFLTLCYYFFSNTLVFEGVSKSPETPNTEETSVAYNSMENTTSEDSGGLSPTKTHDEIEDFIEHDQNLALLPIDETPEIQLNGELFKENCDIIDGENELLDFDEEEEEIDEAEKGITSDEIKKETIKKEFLPAKTILDYISKTVTSKMTKYIYFSSPKIFHE